MRCKHLTIDCYECDTTKLNDEELIKKFLIKVIEIVEMKWLSPVTVYNAVKGEAPGKTGGGIISTSHIYIHTFTEDREFKFDLLSCKDFSSRQVINLAKETFESNKTIVKQMER